MGKPFSFRHRFFSRFHDVIISKIGRGCLVGARLRRYRIPTNMGLAQLASHSPHYPNSRMRPIFSFPAAPAAADASERRPYQRHLVGARLRTRPLTPCRPHITDASERRPYQLLPPKQKPAAFLPRGKLANNSLQQWNIGKVGI